MKKSILFIITLMTIALTISNSTHCSFPRAQKVEMNNKKADELTKTIQTKMESAQSASTPEERQRLNKELKNDIEEATTYFDSVQNFFGYGPLSEKRRNQAEKQKSALEQQLFLEKKHFKTLHNDIDKEKSLTKQSKLENRIHTEKIALGQAWSWKQKALAAALAGATAYLGYQYGGQAVTSAKGLLGGKTTQTTTYQEPLTTQNYEEFISTGNTKLPKGTWKKFMKAGALDIPREPLTPENLSDINPEDYIRVSTSNNTPSSATQSSWLAKGYGQTPQHKATIASNMTMPIAPETTTPTPSKIASNTPLTDDIGYYESFINTTPEEAKGWSKWMQDYAYYYYNLLPSLGSTTTNE